jgi:hypothetical protein
MVREGDIEKTGNLHTSRPRYEEHIWSRNPDDQNL